MTLEEAKRELVKFVRLKTTQQPAFLDVILEAIPAADVVEMRHGENIGEDYDAVDQFVCSKCGIELQGWYRVERDMDDGEETHHEYTFRYCPNCGAKMDGGADDAAD